MALGMLEGKKTSDTEKVIEAIMVENVQNLVRDMYYTKHCVTL